MRFWSKESIHVGRAYWHQKVWGLWSKESIHVGRACLTERKYEREKPCPMLYKKQDSPTQKPNSKKPKEAQRKKPKQRVDSRITKWRSGSREFAYPETQLQKARRSPKKEAQAKSWDFRKYERVGVKWRKKIEYETLESMREKNHALCSIDL